MYWKNPQQPRASYRDGTLTASYALGSACENENHSNGIISTDLKMPPASRVKDGNTYLFARTEYFGTHAHSVYLHDEGDKLPDSVIANNDVIKAKKVV